MKNQNIGVISILIPFYKVSLKNSEKVQRIAQAEIERIAELSLFTEEILVRIVMKVMKAIELV